ncbi:MAG: hypothetical protein ABH852_02890 [Methanobacteriota archaeon]
MLLGMITSNKKSTRYAAKKIIPPVRPLLSTFAKEELKARQEGKPMPKANPQKMSTAATSMSPKLDRAKGNNEEMTPKAIQERMKWTLLNFLAAKGPAIKEIMAAR